VGAASATEQVIFSWGPCKLNVSQVNEARKGIHQAVRLYIYTHVCMYTYILDIYCVYLLGYTRWCLYMYIHTCTHIYLHSIYIVCVSSRGARTRNGSQVQETCKAIHQAVRMYVYIYIHVYIYINTYIYIYIYINIYIQIHIYTYIPTYCTYSPCAFSRGVCKCNVSQN